MWNTIGQWLWDKWIGCKQGTFNDIFWYWIFDKYQKYRP